jgi:hypothetical protein
VQDEAASAGMGEFTLPVKNPGFMSRKIRLVDVTRQLIGGGKTVPQAGLTTVSFHAVAVTASISAMHLREVNDDLDYRAFVRIIWVCIAKTPNVMQYGIHE